MDLQKHRQLFGSLSYGKRLPGALYILRPQQGDVCSDIWGIISRAELASRPDPAWNLLKIHTDQVAFTFLTYPDFDTNPHPALAEASKINLNTGSVSRSDYRKRANPPILHRKETFLPPSHPRIFEYRALTEREEEAGLYRDPSRIGLRVQWLMLLKRLGFSHQGHSLCTIEKVPSETTYSNAGRVRVERHRTAIKRYDLSKPVKRLLERGLLRKGDTFFDYGCGQWDGHRGAAALGVPRHGLGSGIPSERAEDAGGCGQSRLRAERYRGADRTDCDIARIVCVNGEGSPYLDNGERAGNRLALPSVS